MKLPALAFTAALAGLAGACSAPPPAAAPAATQVEATVAHATMADFPSQFEAGGVVGAKLTAVVSSRVLAPIAFVHVRAGDRVRRGQPLVALDGRDLQANAVRAVAALQAAQQATRAAQAGEQGAAAALTLARATHDRIAALAARRSATAQELDEAVAGLSGAEARAAGAKAQAAEAAAGLDAARAASDAAAITASYAVIAAPFDGIVTERNVDPGSVAAPGVPLLTVEDTSAYHLEVRLDEARAAGVTAGQPAEVRLESTGGGEGAWLPGRVTEVARVDAASHSFTAKIECPPGRDYRSGLFGRARFTTGTRRALVAPAGALVRRGQVTFVYAVTPEGLARLRAVSIGQTTSDLAEIIAGVAAGDALVVNPPAAMTDGVRVKNMPQARAEAAGDRR